MERHAAILIAAAAGFACGGDAPDAAAAADSRADSPPAASTTVVDTPVAHASLAAFLPETFAQLTRSAVEEHTQNFMDATSHSVQADYAASGAIGLAPVHIKLWDHGASEYMITTYGILKTASEEETDGGYVRHTTFRGHPVSERQSGSDAQMEIWVGDRYLVDINGRGMTVEDLREAAGSLDLEGLGSLDGQG